MGAEEQESLGMEEGSAGKRIAFVTGADRGLGLALTAHLLQKGWRVFAGQHRPDWPELDGLMTRHPGHLAVVPLDVMQESSAAAAAQAVQAAAGRVDLLINNAGVSTLTKDRSIRDGQDYDEMQRLYDVNALGPLRVVTAFLPLTDRSPMKRLCFVSSEAGSINRCQREAWYAYCMSKAALNMGAKILFNLLRPEGYTFRVYHPGWMRTYMNGSKNNAADLEPDGAALPAIAYFLRDRAYDPNKTGHTDEDRLVLRDYLGCEWPW
jgi:NAD(P)-dependent dehydrogenase (short-subunit alcohol dehydrogenase family)